MPALSKTSAIVVVVLALGLFPRGIHAQPGPSSPEGELFNAANQERRARGLPALKWDDALASAARKHALAMAGHDTVSHQLPGEMSLPTRARQAGFQFVWLSENVTQGPNLANVHKQFMDSPTHRANLLDADMNAAGFAVVGHNGKFFVVQDFARAK